MVDLSWFIGDHDINKLLKFFETRVDSIDKQLGETNRLLEEIRDRLDDL
jgi:hypothetical protein